MVNRTVLSLKKMLYNIWLIFVVWLSNDTLQNRQDLAQPRPKSTLLCKKNYLVDLHISNIVLRIKMELWLKNVKEMITANLVASWLWCQHVKQAQRLNVPYSITVALPFVYCDITIDMIDHCDITMVHYDITMVHYDIIISLLTQHV